MHMDDSRYVFRAEFLSVKGAFRHTICGVDGR